MRISGGDGYKIAMKRIFGLSPRINLMEKAVKYLFPIHNEGIFDCDNRNRFSDFTPEEIQSAGSKLKTGKAPEKKPNRIARWQMNPLLQLSRN